MKKAAIVILSLLLLTGCWDRLPLRDLNLVDIAGVDLDEKSGGVLLNFVVTKLKKAGQGGGEPFSETTELKGRNIVEAFEQGVYHDRGPFSGINTGVFLLSEKFVANAPFQELAFLLHARNTSINTSVVVYEGSVSKLIKNKSSESKTFARNMFLFNKSLKTNGIIPTVSMMHFILSHGDPLEDMLLPMVKQSDSGLELDGALLFRQGESTGVKLSKEQIRMVMFLGGHGKGKKKVAVNLSQNGEARQPHTGQVDGTTYAFSAQKVDSKITVRSEASGLPEVGIRVRLKINVIELGQEIHLLKSDYVERMEKELATHLEETAAATIKVLQKANCDALGIGMQIKAFHPNIWKSLNWRKDYPQLPIVPHFDVEILNADAD
ncbi:germination protein, Ger(x)C family [Paenibacillus sp. yr247]|uniref:Ger(x)C family spore germination C-terminal domain-containing protein n=1 Tax=Paenibacillus sp. yr247 TaxID=1761880 RepID=UPI00088F329B|nr:Ger(x)C family spore germination C-terminal domain-containing protein [Paenibacillus sp. yr247]SDM78032.1 germination protein, Ger(x)C family [Paenibacillus sp. yr247]